jgi:hypothetical protein
MSTLPGLVLSDIAADVRNDYSSEAIQDGGLFKIETVGYFQGNALPISGTHFGGNILSDLRS